jgi:hypothetical protein
MNARPNNLWIESSISIALLILTLLLKGVMCYVMVGCYYVLMSRELAGSSSKAPPDANARASYAKFFNLIALPAMTASSLIYVQAQFFQFFDLRALPITGIGLPFPWEDDLTRHEFGKHWNDALMSGALGFIAAMAIIIFLRNWISEMLAGAIRWVWANPSRFKDAQRASWRRWVLPAIGLLVMDGAVGGTAYLYQWHPRLYGSAYKDYAFMVLGLPCIPIFTFVVAAAYIVHSKAVANSTPSIDRFGAMK